MAGQSRFFIGFSASVAGFCRHFCCLKPTGFWLNLTSRIWFKSAIHGYQGFDSCPVSIRRVQEMNVVAYNRAIGACTKSHSLALGQTWQAGKSHGKSAIEFDDFPTKTSIWFGDYQRGRFFFIVVPKKIQTRWHVPPFFGIGLEFWASFWGIATCFGTDFCPE